MPLLEARGHRFHSRTDTEVVLHAYEEWGPDCLDRFNGMFAFAIWDTRRRRLFLARDRFGIKPLYYAVYDGRFVFASEIKAILQTGLPRRVSPGALVEYFTFQNVFSDRTLFEGVRLLPPGHSMTASEDGVESKRFWDLEPDPDEGVNEAEWAERIRGVFEESVTRQLISDVPVGSYLSGGMDSGSIVAVASKHVPRLMTFTGGFDLSSVEGLELVFDERTDAEAVASQFKTQHYEMVLHAGDLAWVLPELVWHLEDLRVGMSYQNYYIAGLAAKFVKVSLAGAGGDELFAGYPWRYYRAVVNDDVDHYVEKYYRFWHRLIPNRFMPELFRPDLWADVRDYRTIDVFRSRLPDRVRSPESPEEYVNYSLYLEAKTFLQGLLLVEDKLSMAHSLETRVPFLDNDLVEFAQRLPVRLKLRDLDHVVKLNENEPAPKTGRYWEKTRDGKLLLRRAMDRYVPSDVTDQVKQGFSGPDATWFRGESIDYVRRTIDNPDARIYEFFQPRTVQALVEEHLSGAENRRLLLWSLLNFEHWCETFLEGRRAESGIPVSAVAASA
jgi:asparagine synthase (glutamine-hydrolysing)